MNLRQITKPFSTAKNWFLSLSLIFKIVTVLVIGGIGWFTASKIIKTNSSTIQYETSPVTKGTLITSISSSGTITSGNYTNISTKVSGTVKKVYVTNGDTVAKGQKIAEITLDDYAKERQTAAWVSYLNATEAVKDAQTAQTTSDISMWTARQALLDAQDEFNNMKAGGWNQQTRKEYTYNEQAIVSKKLDEAQKAFSSAQAKYLNAGADISNSQSKVASALRDYQENSSIIVAPTAGIVSDLSLAENMVVTANSSTSNTNGSTIISSQTVGKINDPNGQLIATVSLTESEVTKVAANQKVNLTLDAFPDKTFTGKVLSVNTSGSISSGVTSYPVTIVLDATTEDIYPNMSVTAQIITNIKTDILYIPTTAITTMSDSSTVQVRKNNQNSTVTVQVGISNDSDTEITSGLSEGDEVVTSIIDTSTVTKTSGTSVFSSSNRTSTSTSKSTSTTRSSGAVMMGGPMGL